MSSQSPFDAEDPPGRPDNCQGWPGADAGPGVRGDGPRAGCRGDAPGAHRRGAELRREFPPRRVGTGHGGAGERRRDRHRRCGGGVGVAGW